MPSKLKEYATSKKDIKSGNEKLPPGNFIMANENVYEPLDLGKQKSSAQSTGLTITEDDLVQPGAHRATFIKEGGDKNANLDDFIIKKVIGRGSFGKVFLVQKKHSGEVYAMKSLRKDVILEYDQVESTRLEKDILLQADHPFLVGMSYVFQSDSKIFFVMRFVRGGELFMHLRQVTRFPEERAKFYSMQVAMALGHLH